jgi:hypothetical protein
VASGLNRDDAPGDIIEYHKAELVVGPQVSDCKPGGGFGMFERASVHRPAPVQHDTERRRSGARLFDRGRFKTDGEMDRAGLIGEDGFIVEEIFDFHAPILTHRV